MQENNTPIQVEQVIQQWEYKDPPLDISANGLNKLGEEGWEAFCISTSSGHTRTMLKRPKPKTKREPDYGYGR